MNKDYSAERIECDELPAPPSEIIVPDDATLQDARNLRLMYKIWFAAIVGIVLFCALVIK